VIGADGLQDTEVHLRLRAFERHPGYMVAAVGVSGYWARDEGVYVLYGTNGGR
jgi:hypothetical protein